MTDMRNRRHYGRAGSGLAVRAALLFLLASPMTPQGKPAPQGAGKDAQAVVPSALDRQKAMQADMDRLLQLARQLKAEVDQSRKDELSIKVIRDADEIDKLARSARGRIR